MRGSILCGAVLSAFLACSGCGDPTLDGSSEEAFKKSVEDVKRPLDPATAERFEKAVGTLMISKVVLAQGVVDDASAKSKLKEVFDGKTADEVIAEGEKVSGESKAAIEKMMRE
jgi:hypothetical protein